MARRKGTGVLTKSMTFSLSPEMLANIKRAAEYQNKPDSEIIRLAIADYLKPRKGALISAMHE